MLQKKQIQKLELMIVIFFFRTFLQMNVSFCGILLLEFEKRTGWKKTGCASSAKFLFYLWRSWVIR